MKRLVNSLCLFAACLTAQAAGLNRTVGTFTKSAGTPPFTQSVTTSDPTTATAFQPKALIFWTTGSSATGFTAGMIFAFGLSDCTAHRSFSIAAGNGQTGTQTQPGHWYQAAIAWNDTSGTIQEYATVTCTSTGFTLTWDTGTGAGTIYGFAALGGTSLTGSKLLTGITTNTTTGTKAYTGMGFQPNVIIPISVAVTSDADQLALTTAAMMISQSSSTSFSDGKSWDLNPTSQGSTASAQAHTDDRTSQAMILRNATSSATLNAERVNSFDADGFTLNCLSSNGTAYNFAALGLAGETVDGGSAAKPTAAGPASLTITTGLTAPDFGMFFALDDATASNNTAAVDINFTIGFTDGTNYGSAYAYMQNAQATSVTESYLSTTSALSSNVGSTQNSLATAATFSGSDINMTFNPNNATSTSIQWMVLGPSPTVTGASPSGHAILF